MWKSSDMVSLSVESVCGEFCKMLEKVKCGGTGLLLLILLSGRGTAMKIGGGRGESRPQKEYSMPNISLVNITDHPYFGAMSYREQGVGTNLTFANETVYVVPSSKNFLVFECNANYPIQWNLGGSLSPSVYHTVRVLSVRQFSDPFDPSTFTYVSFLTMDGPSPRLTGNYSCESTTRSSLSSNIYIFWQGSYESALIYSRENFTQSLSSLDEVIRLPCQVSDPHLQPKLDKIDSEKPEKNSEQLHLNESIEYYPAVGFTLKNLPSPLGLYKCWVDEKEPVFIHVLQANQTTTKYSFEYDDENKQVKCCSNSRKGDEKKSPKIYMMDCQHPSTCSIREHMSATSESTHYYYNQGKRRGSCSIFNLRNYHSGVVRCYAHGFSTYAEFITPVEERQLSWMEKRNTTTYFHWEEIDPQEMLVVTTRNYLSPYYYRGPYQLDSVEDATIYSNQSVQLTCHTSRYYFASGVYWMVRWKNGSVTRLGEKEGRVTNDENLLYERDRHADTISFVAEMGMDSVLCFAPVWNSSVWVPKIHYLYVNESMPPVMETVEMVNYTWYANDTGKTLSCEATGLPAPTFRWEKENETILESSHNYNIKVENSTEEEGTETTVTTESTSEGNGSAEGVGKGRVGVTRLTSLTISRVSYSTRGVFRCVASNVGGSTTKEFTISVVERKSWTVTMLLVGASIATVALIAGIIYLLKRLYQDRKEISQLSGASSLSPSSSLNLNGSSRVFGEPELQNGNGRTEDFMRNDSANHSITFDSGTMRNNLIDTF